jgi:hypothetical protein
MNQSIQNLNEQEQGYRHSPANAEFTATAAIARMDKRFIVVVGNCWDDGEASRGIMIRYFCCQNFETKIQTKAGAYNPTQLHTSWYLKAWIQL